MVFLIGLKTDSQQNLIKIGDHCDHKTKNNCYLSLIRDCLTELAVNKKSNQIR